MEVPFDVRRVFLSILGLLLAIPLEPTLYASSGGDGEVNLPVAFIRHQKLWLKDNLGERQASPSLVLEAPRWSADGKFVAVVAKASHPGQTAGKLEAEAVGRTALEVVERQTGERTTVVTSRTSGDRSLPVQYQWSPTGHQLAFLVNHSLGIATVDNQVHVQRGIAQGVDDFTWMPGNAGFILATDAHRLPEGWTNVRIYKLSPAALRKQPPRAIARHRHLGLLGGMQGSQQTDRQKSQLSLLCQLPKTVGEASFPIRRVEHLTWSHDGRWLAVIAKSAGGGAPASSGSGMVCVLSEDGHTFQAVGETLPNRSWLAWSSAADTLAYIRGSDGDVAHNKKLTLATAPRFESRSLSPMASVDNDFCWLDASHIVVSRRQENLLAQSPLARGAASPQQPALFNIDVNRPAIQNRMTNPPVGTGDYQPQVAGWQQVAWLRSSPYSQKGELWLGKVDGTKVETWLDDITRKQPAFSVLTPGGQQAEHSMLEETLPRAKALPVGR